jgi:ribonuclease HI
VSDYVIYTDGACRGNPGPGGWAAVVGGGVDEQVLSGAETETTNNRMELSAVIMALRALPAGAVAVLHTDSEYVIKGITEWLPAWKARGWKTAAKKPVKNQDLWEELEAARQGRRVDWRWVRGHAGNPGNERVDRLANAAIDRMLGGRS